MDVVVHMPKFGMTVSEAKVETWFVEEGDNVDLDMDLVEVSENKAVHTIKSKTSGVVTKILVQEGAMAKPGTDLAIISATE